MEITKAQLVAEIAEHSGQTQEVAKAVLDSLVDVVNEHVRTMDVVGLPGLGKWQAVETRERTMTNPQTGEPMTVAASYRVKFKVATRLKDSAKAP